jgi:hypothetical protein
VSRARAVARTEVRHVIIRACRDCGHARQADVPCAGCGLAEQPERRDLGVQAARYRNPLRQAWWLAVRAPLAARRARAASRPR